ncbi:MAG: RNA polymerase sigma factor [Actinomycetota bacterium]
MDIEAEYRAHLGDLLHFATVLVGPHDAADVVNEAVTATLRRGSLAAVLDVRAYWFRAVANTAAGWHRSGFRRRAREARVAASATRQSSPSTPEDARAVLAALSTQQRKAVYLAYWLDWPVDRIADAMGATEGTVKQHLARGRARLKELLHDDR